MLRCLLTACCLSVIPNRIDTMILRVQTPQCNRESEDDLGENLGYSLIWFIWPCVCKTRSKLRTRRDSDIPKTLSMPPSAMKSFTITVNWNTVSLLSSCGGCLCHRPPRHVYDPGKWLRHIGVLMCFASMSVYTNMEDKGEIWSEDWLLINYGQDRQFNGFW